METILNLFVLVPIVGFVISLLIPGKRENLISFWVFSIVFLHALGAISFVGYWLWLGHPVLDVKDLSLFSTSGYEFFVDLYFDKATAMYLLVGSFLTMLVAIYSRYYMHRESGYKRFFNTILFFYVGYTIVIFAGNLETMFIGWEILGISSFLLIAFYRDRYLPVKNAIKVFSIYRIGDIGIILAMWLSHHLFHENITFAKLHNYDMVSHHLSQHSYVGIVISIMILISAAAKSAQLPFSSWLPRAMEGPTPSSAIFYGSLSVHIGAFLLLRTHPFWEHQFSVRVLIGLLGLSTSIIASSIARVQSSVKSQIAYASIAQIGIIFIEIAAGFELLALIHFAGNAFLRTYQLLVSPSVVSYLIREQFYNFVPRPLTVEDSFPKRVQYSIYVLSLKEWNLDSFMYKIYWGPLKRIGSRLKFLTVNSSLLVFVVFFSAGIILLQYEKEIPDSLHAILPAFFSLIGLMMVLKSFTERTHPRLSLLLVIMNHFWIALAVSFNEHFSFSHTSLYLSGIVVSGIAGIACLQLLLSKEKNISLDQFQGHSYEHPKYSLVFLLACLGLAGFPITTAFIGEDLIFSHIHSDQVFLALTVSLSLLLDGLALIRIYARVFLGPHVKSYHERAYKSS